MRFEYYQDDTSDWRWRLRSDNNKIVADSAEGYRNKADCLHGISLVKSAHNATIEEVAVGFSSLADLALRIPGASRTNRIAQLLIDGPSLADLGKKL